MKLIFIITNKHSIEIDIIYKQHLRTTKVL